MDSAPLLRYIIFGQLRREFILPPGGPPYLNGLGGSLAYAAGGLGVWERGAGLTARIGEDYPQEWLSTIARRGFDLRGIRIVPDSLDLRSFIAYQDANTPLYENPVSHFSRLGLPFPKSLLGYTPPGPQLDSRINPTSVTIRLGDFPQDYLDATAAHICPLDYVSHSLLPAVLRRGHVSTITLDPAAGYMNPTFWNEIPALLNGLTALLVPEDRLRGLFQGRTSDLWEMCAGLAAYGCEIIAVRRGAEGFALFDNGNHSRWTVPAYPARMVDPTGAGDAFCGGFLAGYRNTYSPLQAVLFGIISASMKVEGCGPFYGMDALPVLARARLEALQNMVRKV